MSDETVDEHHMPPWVKWSAIIAIVVLVLLIVLAWTGDPGSHGPGRHA